MQPKDGRGGGLAGGLATALLTAGLLLLPELPAPDASTQTVFTFFLEEESSIPLAAALVIVAMVFAAALFSSLKVMLAARDQELLGTTMMSSALLGIGALAFSAAMLAAGAIRAGDTDPAASRSLLDLGDLGVAVAGPALALALACLGTALLRSGDLLPRPVVPLTFAAAGACLLWPARLLADSGALAADGVLGSTLGWLALLAWLACTSALLGLHRPRQKGPPGGAKGRRRARKGTRS